MGLDMSFKTPRPCNRASHIQFLLPSAPSMTVSVVVFTLVSKQPTLDLHGEIRVIYLSSMQISAQIAPNFSSLS